MAKTTRPSAKAQAIAPSALPPKVRTRPRKKAASSPIAPSLPVTPPAAPLTRKATLMSLLSRPDGAALAELVTATQWKVHSVRAALTHFRHAGFTVNRTCDAEGASRYHLIGA